MTLRKFKWITLSAVGGLILAGCGSSEIVSPPIENIDQMPLKTIDATDDELRSWSASDLTTDTIPGMSVNRAYTELIKDKKGKQVIVAVIDSGVDIEHEDLDDNIWTNKDEVPNNNKDDDNNGYVDDIHGWNFLGDIVKENLEYQRIIRDKDMMPADKVQKAQVKYDEEMEQAEQQVQSYSSTLKTVRQTDQILSEALTPNYTMEEVRNLEPKDNSQKQAKQIAIGIYERNSVTPKEAIEQLSSMVEDAKMMQSGKAITTNYRKEKLGDDPYSMDVKNYGNADVDGPDNGKDHTLHGTHVAGIIGAERNNGIGMDGVANNVKIMVLRAVPNGDEYDKDIALSIRYAVDNGAKVINTSFGKYHSTNPEWVWDAIKYAEENDVLIVNAAGNESTNTDETMVYPQDQEIGGEEIASNFLTVGALNYKYGKKLVASFSNYGAKSVDTFGPGVKIYATAPGNDYQYLQGTSMASPNVAGVAAVIRSLYPDLSAAQVKQVIMDSGVSSNANVSAGDSVSKFSELSTSGKMTNLYNAIIMASKM